MIVFFFYVLISVLTIGLGILPLINNGKSKSNISFFFVCLFSSLWAILNYFSIIVNEYDLKIFIVRSVLFVTTFLASSLVVFGFTYPNKNISKVKLKIILYVSLIISIVMFHPLTVEKLNIDSKGFTLEFGILFPIYLIYISLCLFVCLLKNL